MKTLVIGYGNELRSDDGVGPRLARLVAGWGLPHVGGIAVHQLTPELAADCAAVDRVVFMDASSDPNVRMVRWSVLEAGEAGGVGSHLGDPAAILGLSKLLYGRAPQGVLLEIPGEHFDLGECLSTRATRGMTDALELMRRLLDSDPGGRAWPDSEK